MPEGVLLKRPAIFDPEQESVFDSGGEKLVRRIIEFFGGGEPADEVANMVGIMPLGSPIRNISQRAAKLADLAGQARKISPVVGEAFDHLARRFPRMMAHTENIGAVDNPHMMGRFRPGAAIDPRDIGRGNVGGIDINPALHASNVDAVDTLAHEMTHGAQTLRAADRLRSARAAGRTSLPSLDAAQGVDDLRFLPADQAGAALYLGPNDIAAAELGPTTVGINQANRFRRGGAGSGALRTIHRRAAETEALQRVGERMEETPEEVLGMIEWLRNNR